jgi:hypothetical protein
MPRRPALAIEQPFKLPTGELLMKAYLITTVLVFGLLTGAHIWRGVSDEPNLLVEPWFIVMTVVAGTLCVWGSWLLTKMLRSRP